MTNPETRQKRELQEAFDAGVCWSATCMHQNKAYPAEQGFNEWLEKSRKDLVIDRTES